MRIAVIGTRGIPAGYGGFETFAEELGSRLVERGHEVTVYGRAHTAPKPEVYRGVRLRWLPTVRHKYLETVVHTALSVADSLIRRYDIALVCNNANAPFAWIPEIVGTRVALNVDGLEWQRSKWGVLGRAYYRLCSRLAPLLPVTLISDAVVIADYYRDHGAASLYIPYGTDARRLAAGAALERLGLKRDGYLLYVSRLEPENNADLVINAYARAGGVATLGVPLVVVGDAPYANTFIRRLKMDASAIGNVLMPGAIFGDGYAELQSNCLVYIQATEVGGTHPALVEAMGRGVPIVANDVPEHREVLGEAGVYYARNDAAALAEQLRMLVADAHRRRTLATNARARAQATYSWDRVADSYESLFTGLTQARRRKTPGPRRR